MIVSGPLAVDLVSGLNAPQVARRHCGQRAMCGGVTEGVCIRSGGCHGDVLEC